MPLGSDWGGLADSVDMPRQLRVEYPGAIYHVMSRGDRKKAIFWDEVDRQDFLKTLAAACQKTEFPGACVLSDAQSLPPAG